MRIVNNKTVMSSNVLNHHQPSELAGNLSKLLKMMREAEEEQVPGDVEQQTQDIEQPEENTDNSEDFNAGYNQALDDVVKLVKNTFHMGPKDIDSMFTFGELKQSIDKLKKPFGITGPEEKV